MDASDPPSKPPDDVLSNLPRSRPQRRSSKREGVRPAPASPSRAKRDRPAPSAPPHPSAQPKRAAAAPPPSPDPAAEGRPKPAGVRPSAGTRHARGATEPPRRDGGAPSGIELAGTAVAAAGELARLGLSLGARALRNAAARVPKP